MVGALMPDKTDKPAVATPPLPAARDGRLVGITGGIAAGKSRVAEYLADQGGFPGLDVDDLARQLLEPNRPGWLALQHHFGDRFFRRGGALDRPRLRQAIFTDTALRAEIDHLLHPLIRQAMLVRAQAMFLAGAEVVLVEVPLLYEAGWEDDFALILLVQASAELCRQRLRHRDQLSLPEAVAALKAQMPPEEKARRADLLIDNSGNWEQTRRLLDGLIPRLRNLPGTKAGEADLGANKIRMKGEEKP